MADVSTGIRRDDLMNRDAALLRPNGDGWLLQGAAAFDHEDGPAAVSDRQQPATATRGLGIGMIVGATVFMVLILLLRPQGLAGASSVRRV